MIEPCKTLQIWRVITRFWSSKPMKCTGIDGYAVRIRPWDVYLAEWLQSSATQELVLRITTHDPNVCLSLLWLCYEYEMSIRNHFMELASQSLIDDLRDMCVWNIWRCKTSNTRSFFFCSFLNFSEFHFQHGTLVVFLFFCCLYLPRCGLCQRSSTLDDQENVRACNFLFPFCRQWQPAKPRTGMSNKWKITIWFWWNCWL